MFDISRLSKPIYDNFGEKSTKKEFNKIVFEEILEELKKEFSRGTLQKPERRSVKEKEDIGITA